MVGREHIRAARAVAAAGVFLVLLAPARGDTRYVAADGDDRAAGTREAPWRTLQHAADQIGPGDEVVVGPGRYRGFELHRSGTADARIRFRADPTSGPRTVVVEPGRRPDGINLEGASYVDIEGFDISGAPRAAIRAVQCRAVHIRNNTVHDNGRWGIFTGFCDDLLIEDNTAWGSQREHGIYVSNSGDRPVIRRNRVFDNAQSGIQLNGDANLGGDGTISEAVVEANVIYGTGRRGGAAINCDGVQRSIIRNNLIYRNAANGITLYRIDAGGSSTDNTVVHNTIAMPARSRWCIRIADASTGNRFENNACVSEHAYRGAIDISADSLPGFASDHNALIGRFTLDDAETVISLAEWRRRTGLDASSIEATASLFADPARDDYTLAAGSPAIDRAGASAAAGPTDHAGRTRVADAAPDIGAFERCDGCEAAAVAPAAPRTEPEPVSESRTLGPSPEPPRVVRPAPTGGCCHGQGGAPYGHAALVFVVAVWLRPSRR